MNIKGFIQGGDDLGEVQRIDHAFVHQAVLIFKIHVVPHFGQRRQ